MTGSGQDVHLVQGHREGQSPDPGPGPQQDAGRAALRRVPRVLPGEQGRVLRQLLRLLPARGVPAAQRHVHREGLEPQRRDRPAPPRRHARPLRAPGRHHRRVGVVHLRPRRPGRLRRDRAQAQDRRAVPSRRRAAPPRGPPVPAQRPGPDPCPLPGPRRHARAPAGLGGDPRPGRVLRRCRRAHHRARPAHRRAAGRAEGDQRLPGHPLRHAAGQASGSDRRHRCRDGGARRPARGRGPGPRGRPAAAAHHVRPRDDARARVLHRDRELLAAPVAPRGRDRARGRCSITSRPTGCWSSTSRT